MLLHLWLNPTVNLLHALWFISSAIAIDANVSTVLSLGLEIHSVKCSPLLLVILKPKSTSEKPMIPQAGIKIMMT